MCKDIPGDLIARAVSGELKQARSYEGRCVYFISAKDSSKETDAFVIYLHPAEDFVGLKEAAEGKSEVVKGIGDEATLTYDEDSERYWLLVTKQGLVTLQISGEDQDALRKIATAVIHAYGTR